MNAAEEVQQQTNVLSLIRQRISRLGSHTDREGSDIKSNLKMKTEKATFGAGCFWGVEEEFRKLPGVLETAAGYTGGKMKNPAYEDVCTGATGHIEVVQLEFDPKKIAYEELLEKFWALHDPTSMDRQGPDAGTQYRSAIFVHSRKQKSLAEKSKKDIAGKYARPIVTEIMKAPEFYKAEEYHQKYLMKNGLDACRY